jgi:hypothetical protein
MTCRDWILLEWSAVFGWIVARGFSYERGIPERAPLQNYGHFADNRTLWG